MTRHHSDEYDAHEPLLARYAGLEASDVRRGPLRDRLVAAYLPLAQHIARRFARRGEPLDDLEQAASIGLMYALDRFDPDRGTEFLGFAVPTITGEVRRHFRDSTWVVRTPRAVKERFVAVGAATARLSHDLQRSPTASEVAADLGIPVDDVIEALAAQSSYRPGSLDAGTRGADLPLHDVLSVIDPGLDGVERRELVRGLLAQLPERERRMLVLRFVHERTQSEIGAELCLSQMHVSRLLRRTLEMLRDGLELAEAG